MIERKERWILLTTDFSECAREAYAPAASLARWFGARLHAFRKTS